METLRFAFSSVDGDVRPLRPLTTHLSKEIGVRVEPAPAATYPALLEAMRTGWAALGWLPPLLAHDMSVCRDAVPIVAANRELGSSYFAALVATQASGIWHVGQLAGKRIGWVSKMSAAGYVVPRLHLTATGIELEGLFSSERFYRSHTAVRAALGGDRDVVATYLEVTADAGVAVPIDVPHRIVATCGPIPSDVIASSTSLPAEIRRALFHALLAYEPEPGTSLARTTRVARFMALSPSHWTSLERWLDHSRRRSAALAAAP